MQIKEIFPNLYGFVEIIHKTPTKTNIYYSNNMIVRGADNSSDNASPYHSGENLLAYFLSRSNSAKYDAGQGSTQRGYFDFMGLGRGYMLSAAGTSVTKFTIPYSPVDGNEANDFFCNIPGGNGVNWYCHGGANNGQTAVTANTNNYNKTTKEVTLSTGFTNILSANDIVVSDPSNREIKLQGEPDSSGTFKDRHTDTQPVVGYNRKTVTKTIATQKNRVIYSATWNDTGNDTFKLTICEAGIFNTSTIPTDTSSASGDMFARVVFSPIYKNPNDIITINWNFIIGYSRQ